MSPRFLIDAQLPPALADNLRLMGFDADHVNRIGLGAESDAHIWRHAERYGAILITKDEDFVGFADQSGSGPQVVWIRLGNTTNRALWAAISRALPELLVALQAGERVVIVE